MILLLDAGNSRLKWACLVGGVLQSGEAVARTGDNREDVRQLSLAWAPLPRPKRILAANVLGHDFVCALSARTMEAWSVQIEELSSIREAYGVTNGYADPERLGADRWAALIGARRIAGDAPVCVVDCGTAITVDALRADGAHLGGVILPGLALMRRTLTGGTRGIRLDEDHDEWTGIEPFGRDTTAGVVNGTLCAAVAGIDRAVAGMRGELGGEARCLITGGDAERLQPLLAHPFEHESELVLFGLAVAAEGSA